jgi:hypothetical protein
VNLQAFLCVIAAAGAFLIAYRFLTRRGDQRDELLAPLCPSCGYNLRHSTGTCPECGEPVPDHLLLRANLMAEQFPDWLIDPGRARPVRQPAEAETWRRLYAITDLRQVGPLDALLDRAGIDHRSVLQLLPNRTNVLGVPNDAPPMAAVVEVPEHDWPVANELSLYVAWAFENDQLSEMERRFGIEPVPEADPSAT